MGRKLKFHEKKLLKKVDFINWEVDNNLEEVKVLKRYCIKKREDYSKYNKLAREIRILARRIESLDVNDLFRNEHRAQLMEKLFMVGLINSKWNFSDCYRVNAESFCKRRLPTLMVRSKMISSVKQATQFIEQGHVRVGPELVKDPAFIVTRHLEDFVTWVDSSKIRKHILSYNDMDDDFQL